MVIKSRSLGNNSITDKNCSCSNTITLVVPHILATMPFEDPMELSAVWVAMCGENEITLRVDMAGIVKYTRSTINRTVSSKQHFAILFSYEKIKCVCECQIIKFS